MSKKKKTNSKIKTKIRLLLVMLLLLVLIPFGITFSKYIHDFIGSYIIKTNNFYFSSDKLGSPAIHYSVNNWGGVGTFRIQFQLNNHKNNSLISDSDIEYDIDLDCPNDVICSINSNSGVIYTSEMTDSFEVIITPQRIFDPGESIRVVITATSSSPYVKELSADFTITVGRQGINYEISDEVNRPYLDLTITNARDQYTVFEAFGNYAVNDVINTDVYRNLTTENKAKCYSARITLSFDPRNVVIDTTSDFLTQSTYTTTNVNGVSYVSNITFDVDSMSSSVLRFYKLDVSRNYTYPNATNTAVINFSAL